MIIKDIIIYISICENTTILNIKNLIKYFELYIKKEAKLYVNQYGINDYKMHKKDYIILYHLYNNTNKTPNKIIILLLFMYSYYKLDYFDFSQTIFPFKTFFTFLNDNNNIHHLILKLVTQ